MGFLDSLRQEVQALSENLGIPDSKAFTVWFAKAILDLDEGDAFDALSVEGPNEKGMDLFWVDDHDRRVIIAQCKYSLAGNCRPKVKDLTNLLSCIDWLVSPEALEREGREELVAAARDYCDAMSQDFTTHLWFVYCGPRDENVDKRIRVYNANSENEERGRMAIHCDISLLESLYEEASGRRPRIPEATIQVDTRAFEARGTFGKGLVTSVSAPQLVELCGKFGDRLFARNVRGWLGARKGSVNAAIIATLEDEKECGNFWAYNNGITVVCDGYEYSEDTGELELRNFSIVNGCQTTVALIKSESPKLEAVSLVMRVISPPEAIVDSVILYTNSQNLVRKWELVSQDPTQRRLKKEFESLSQPVYYEIRRGEWGPLSPEEKRKFRGPGGKIRKIRHDLLAQYLAAFRGNAVVAYKNKAFLFDRYYEQTFPPDLRVEEALFVWTLGEIAQDLIREEIKKEIQRVQDGDSKREKYVLMLKRGGRFYVLAVAGVVARLRNGPDYLRSIAEERIISKSAEKRLTKYATLSLHWYKQAVDDLMAVTGTDLSVLIREADFFERVAERITNTYEAMSVNEAWLEGALPRLH